MLRKAETLEATLSKQIHSERAREARGAYKSCFGWEDDQAFEEIYHDTLTIIQLLATESPTFGSE